MRDSTPEHKGERKSWLAIETLAICAAEIHESERSYARPYSIVFSHLCSVTIIRAGCSDGTHGTACGDVYVIAAICVLLSGG